MSIEVQVDRYRKYNISRKIKAIKFHEAKASFLLKIVPFLLHSNFPDLPGYVDDTKCQYGIHRFLPQKYINKELFRKYFPNSIALQKDTPSPFTKSPVIHSLKTVGSIGTVAQTYKSDCDYWVSIKNSELGQEGKRLLEEKCSLIETWAETLGIEIYFFLMDIDQTRENRFDSKAEDESAGSALKLLLKDELFRTHILVAGKMLLWWLIPPGFTEQQYKVYVDRLAQQKNVNIDNFVDLGYISDIPKAEIFGACLWQMNKALDSPFKSIIKFAYLELLLADTQNNIGLFSDQIKLLVTFPDKIVRSELKNFKLSEIDPYLLLAREIVAFYQAEKTENKRDEFIRICFFLKTLEGMESQKKEDKKIAHLLQLTDLMEEWHLLPQNVQFYLNFRLWKFTEMINVGSKVHEYLSDTYNRLRLIFKSFENDTVATISEHDVSVLGRKLFTYYQNKPNKVEFIKSLSRETMAQADITLHATRFEGNNYFLAFQGEYDQISIQQKTDYIIKRETHLIRLLVWLIINGILTKTTKIHLTKNYLPVNLTDIQDLVAQLMETFPNIDFAHISSEDLLRNEVIVKALAIINFQKSSIRGTKNLPTTFVLTNSYGEYFIEDYATQTQYKNTLRTLLTKHVVSRWNNNLIIYIPPQDEIHYIQKIISS